MTTPRTRSNTVGNTLPLLLPKHIKEINSHVWRETRNGIVYSEEIQFIQSLDDDREELPVVQLTPELEEAAVAEKENSENSDSEEEECVDEDDDGNKIDVKTSRAVSFYYRGSCKTDSSSHHRVRRSVICRCPKWHLIEKPRMYWLMDHQYTLFEILKGNQRDPSCGFLTEGKFFNESGKLICKTSYDLVEDEYHIKPVVDLLWE